MGNHPLSYLWPTLTDANSPLFYHGDFLKSCSFSVFTWGKKTPLKPQTSAISRKLAANDEYRSKTR